MLKVGSTGEDVKKLQEALCEKGFIVSKDGKFGPATKNAVLDFCRENDITPSSVINSDIAEALELSVTDERFNERFEGCKAGSLRQTILNIITECVSEEVDKDDELAEGPSSNWGVNFVSNVLNTAHSLHGSGKSIEAESIEDLVDQLESVSYNTNSVRPGDVYVYESQRGKKVIGVIVKNTNDTVTGISANSFIDNGEYDHKLVKVYRGVRGKTFYPSRI